LGGGCFRARVYRNKSDNLNHHRRTWDYNTTPTPYSADKRALQRTNNSNTLTNHIDIRDPPTRDHRLPLCPAAILRNNACSINNQSRPAPPTDRAPK
jgi:hypothetical protein